MIDTIIFDVGGVLIDDINKVLESIKNDISLTLKLDRNVVDKAWKEFVPNYLGKGKIDETEFWKRFIKATKSAEKLPKQSLLSRKLKEHHIINYQIMDLVQSLRNKGYKTGILSDTIEAHASVHRSHKLYKPFDVVILSHEVGLRKPEPQIFKLALKRLDSQPRKTVFIDDNEEYIVAANNLGINGIAYKNFYQLLDELAKFGVKISKA